MDAEDVQFTWSRRLEKCGLGQLVLSFLTQVSGEISFPSYNILLGFWCCYCAWTKNVRGIFAFVCLTLLSIILDIAFMATWGTGEENYFETGDNASSSQFALAMMVFNLFAKFWGLWCSAHLWGALGGARAMDSDAPGQMLDRNYSSLPEVSLP
uniref:Uncharacterized protein n=1 Tax=Phaeomonas parva TaxID=124430 RepID=A0A7S1U1Y2_9STRA|mmetsp:Transcript_26824/g.84081  ORF Transcript_26824/g.84081 Transcript_26824/m.84081 type:complete len:154 (+) Transcript_26824:227-688(+)